MEGERRDVAGFRTTLADVGKVRTTFDQNSMELEPKFGRFRANVGRAGPSWVDTGKFSRLEPYSLESKWLRTDTRNPIRNHSKITRKWVRGACLRAARTRALTVAG